MTVNGIQVENEGLCNFFEKIGKTPVKAVKLLATNDMENLRMTIETGAETGSLLISKDPRAAVFAVPGVVNFLSYC